MSVPNQSTKHCLTLLANQELGYLGTVGCRLCCINYLHSGVELLREGFLLVCRFQKSSVCLRIACYAFKVRCNVPGHYVLFLILKVIKGVSVNYMTGRAIAQTNGYLCAF